MERDIEKQADDFFATVPVKTAKVSKSVVTPGSATLTGFTKEQIKEMVDAVYGSCIWERITENGRDLIFCNPGSDGEVRIFLT